MLTFICCLALGSVFLPCRWRVARGGIALVGYGSMCIFLGLRDHIGADWDNYRAIFRSFATPSSLNLYIFVEPLYAICNRLVNIAGGDIHLVNLICATIFLACLFNFSRLVAMDSNLLLFIAAPYLLFVVGMGYTRQSVAIGLVLNAIGYLRHRRERMFYLLAGLAALFHDPAVFVALLWWINSSKRLVSVAVTAAAAVLLVILLLSGNRYVRLYLYNNAAVQSHGVGFRILIIALGLLVILVQKIPWTREPQLRRMILKGAVALGILAILSLFLSTLADRVCLYLFFIYLLGVGSLIRYAKLPFKYLSIYFVICLTYAMFFVWFGLSSYAAASWFPYGISLYGSS